MYKARFIASDGNRTIISTQNMQLSFSTAVTFNTSLSGWSDASSYSPNNSNTDQFHFVGTNGTTTAISSVLDMGKKYMEVKYDVVGNYPMIGLGDAGAAADGYSYGGTNVNYLYYNNTRYPGGGGTGIGEGAHQVNDIINLAWDTDAGQVWLGVNNDYGDKVPGTDAGWTFGDYTAGDGFVFAMSNGSSGGNHRGHILIGSSTTYSPPSGFSAQ